MTTDDSRVRLMLSTQRALLGRVTPRLRAVTITAAALRVRMTYESASDLELELASEAWTEILADIDGVSLDIVETAGEIEADAGETWLFRRYEV